jgi:hypothetical protein
LTDAAEGGQASGSRRGVCHDGTCGLERRAEIDADQTSARANPLGRHPAAAPISDGGVVRSSAAANVLLAFAELCSSRWMNGASCAPV